MLCSSKLAYSDHSCHLTTTAEIYDWAPYVSHCEIIMQPSLRGLWKAPRPIFCWDQQRGLHLTGFETFSEHRARATLVQEAYGLTYIKLRGRGPGLQLAV